QKKTRVTENNARHNLGYLKGKIFIYLYFIKKTSKSLFHQKKKTKNRFLKTNNRLKSFSILKESKKYSFSQIKYRFYQKKYI
ncbi:hypothetical protein, partial [Sphingobacterium sp.]|uniref:hypothetical protein n=1 Tax=Sphingobacterium sp. TaxID=341027 RepID=UPI00289E333C